MYLSRRCCPLASIGGLSLSSLSPSRLFVKVQQLEPETARQITDKLVESLEGTEISYILHDETLLKVKIAEVLVELQVRTDLGVRSGKKGACSGMALHLQTP